MEKQKIINRLDAIESIIKASTKGVCVRNSTEAYMREQGFRNEEDGNIQDYYASLGYEEFYLNKRDDWREMAKFTQNLNERIIAEEYTLEDVGNYLKANPEQAIDAVDTVLEECRDTDEDLQFGYSLYDADAEVISYLGLDYDYSYSGVEPADAVTAVLDKGISLDKIPEKLLFNPSFVIEYIEQVSAIRAKEIEGKTITPQDIENASNSVKLDNFRGAIGNIKSIADPEKTLNKVNDKDLDD